MVPTFTGSCACRVPKRPSTTECRKGSQKVTFQTHPTRLSCHHRAFLVRPAAVDSKAASQVTQASQRPMLQDHVAFFDSDDDGIIWPVDTFHGFQKLGFGPPTAVIQALAIHLPNSFKTLPQGQSFDPRFPIYVENIHKAKHGSDTGSFSKTGDFVKEKFEEIWIRQGFSL